MPIMALIYLKIMLITLYKKCFAWMFFFLSILNLMCLKYTVRFDNIFRNKFDF